MYIILGDYTCDYLHNSGEVCGCEYRQPERCFDYWRSKKLFFVKFVISLLVLNLDYVELMLKDIML